MSPRRQFHALAFLGALCLAAAVPAGSAHAAEPPRVVASILPIHSLVAGVMAGVAEPTLLVTGAASPHSYSLRPSDARALDAAQVIFWIGPSLEGFLAKPLVALAGGARIVTLLETSGLTLLPVRAGGAWEDDEHGHDHEGAAPALHPSAGPASGANPHVWLDPRNAQRIVLTAATVLGAADPAHATTYEANARSLVERLEALDADLAARLAPVAEAPFVVFHDAYQNLEARYGLNAVGAFSLNPALPPGAKRLAELRERVEHLGAACVFTEPQFEPALARAVIEGTGARTAVLDPLGVGLEPGPEAYFQLMRRLAESLVGCLRPSG